MILRSVRLLVVASALTRLVSGQQYCVSGQITSIEACNNCKFKVGDAVSLTATVAPSTLQCSGPAGSRLCTAKLSTVWTVGSRSWASTGAPGLLTAANLAPDANGDATSFTLASANDNLTPANSADPDSLGQIFFGLSRYPGDLIAGGTLPTSIPAPSAVSAANALGAFHAGFPGDGALSQISYTGQNCVQAPPAPPTVNAGGIVPIYSAATTIQPGAWFSIFGSNLAAGTATWNGDFPTALGNTSVAVNGKPAYLWYVSPGQINLQAPDDTARGSVNVVVTTPGGSVTSTVALGQFAPSFSLLDGKHVAAIILRADGSGAYGGGTYDIAGPTGTSLGYKTVAAKAGDVLAIFGVGFGPTNPSVLAGKPYSGAAATTNPVTLTINNVSVTPSFAGLTSAGLYQINVTLPAGLGTGDVALQATVGGARTQSGVVLPVQ
jgi:uncharacterized protein (TIGR03437 family)